MQHSISKLNPVIIIRAMLPFLCLVALISGCKKPDPLSAQVVLDGKVRVKWEFASSGYSWYRCEAANDTYLAAFALKKRPWPKEDQLYLLLLDAQTGALKWEWPFPVAGSFTPHRFPVAFDQTTLYLLYGQALFAKDADIPKGEALYLEAFDLETGHSKWRNRLDNRLRGAGLKITQDQVIVESMAGDIIGFYKKDHTVAWEHSLPGMPDLGYRAPVISNDFLLWDWRSQIKSKQGLDCINLRTGQLQWRYETDFKWDMRALPLVLENRAFWAESDRIQADDNQGASSLKLLCYTVDDGKQAWNKSLPSVGLLTVRYTALFGIGTRYKFPGKEPESLVQWTVDTATGEKLSEDEMPASELVLWPHTNTNPSSQVAVFLAAKQVIDYDHYLLWIDLDEWETTATCIIPRVRDIPRPNFALHRDQAFISFEKKGILCLESTEP